MHARPADLVELGGVGASAGRAQLRAEAAQAYAASGLSLAELRRQPRFSKIPRRTWERWCAADNWTERRRAFLQKAAETAEDQAIQKLTASRAQEIDDCLDIRAQARNKLRSGLVQARSWESVARVLVEVNARLAVLRDATLRQEPANHDAEGADAGDELTDEEVQIVAEALLRARRARQQHDADADESEE